MGPPLGHRRGAEGGSQGVKIRPCCHSTRLSPFLSLGELKLHGRSPGGAPSNKLDAEDCGSGSHAPDTSFSLRPALSTSWGAEDPSPGLCLSILQDARDLGPSLLLLRPRGPGPGP